MSEDGRFQASAVAAAPTGPAEVLGATVARCPSLGRWQPLPGSTTPAHSPSRPARVNIFAKADGGEGERSSSRTRAAGVFDAAAACAPVTGAWSERRGRRDTGVPARWRALVVPLIAVAALGVALAAQSHDEGAADRATPGLQRLGKPRASDRPKRRPQAARANPTHGPARKRGKPDRATRPRRTPGGRSQTPHASPVPIAPRAATPRRSPSSAAPAVPLAEPSSAPPARRAPAPVPSDSPPEFM